MDSREYRRRIRRSRMSDDAKERDRRRRAAATHHMRVGECRVRGLLSARAVGIRVCG